DAVNETHPERGCWPSIVRIMQRSGASHGAAWNALALLERHGWISVERHTGCPNRYRLTLPDPSASRTGDPSGRRTGPTRPPDGRHPSGRRTTPVHSLDTNQEGNLQRTTDSTEEEARSQRRRVVPAP